MKVLFADRRRGDGIVGEGASTGQPSGRAKRERPWEVRGRCDHPLLKATARASDEYGCTTPGRLARKDRAVHPLQYPAGSGVSLLRARDKIPSLV